MKRSGPPARKTPLKADPAKARAWQQRSAEKAAKNAQEPRVARLPVPEHVRRAGTAARKAAAAERRVLVRCANPECGREFDVKPSQAARRKTCSTRCAAAVKRTTQRGRRKGEKNPNFRHGKRAGVRERAGERAFRDVTAVGCRHPGCERTTTEVDQHHVVYVQEIRRVGGDRWDDRNALQLCKACHSSHHRRGSRVVPLAVLRDEAYAFAEETLGAGPAYEYLRRRYAGDDPRLDALLVRAG